MPSTVTDVMAFRPTIADAELLRAIANREGTTVSAVIRRIIREAAPRLRA
jgi:hypothetical protein